MTIRLSMAQARALSKLEFREAQSPRDIGETDATCFALTVAGYARSVTDVWGVKYVKIKDLR